MTIAILGILSFVAFALVTATAGAQTLSDAQVEAAIKTGLNHAYDHLVSTCVAVGLSVRGEPHTKEVFTRDKRLGTYTVTISGSAGRVAFLAAEAGRRQLPFALPDVPDGAKHSGIFVFADPDEPRPENETGPVTPPMGLMFVQFGTGKRLGAAEPDSLTMEPVERHDTIGATVASTRWLAFYSGSSVSLWPRHDDGEVVIYAAKAGMYRCKIGKRDWLRFSQAQ